MVRDEARVFEQMNSFQVWGCKTFLNLHLNLSESKPKCSSLVSTFFKDGSGISISFATLIWRELSFLNRRSLQPCQTVDA